MPPPFLRKGAALVPLRLARNLAPSPSAAASQGQTNAVNRDSPDNVSPFPKTVARIAVAGNFDHDPVVCMSISLFIGLILRLETLSPGQCQLVVRRPDTALRVTGSASTRRYVERPDVGGLGAARLRSA